MSPSLQHGSSNELSNVRHLINFISLKSSAPLLSTAACTVDRDRSLLDWLDSKLFLFPKKYRESVEQLKRNVHLASSDSLQVDSLLKEIFAALSDFQCRYWKGTVECVIHIYIHYTCIDTKSMSNGSAVRRDSIRLGPDEVERLRQIFDDSLKELVEDDGEMSDLLNFTVVMIQNGKSVTEMEQELDDIYGGEYAQRIGLLLNDYFQRSTGALDAVQHDQEHGDAEHATSARVVSVKVRSVRSERLVVNFLVSPRCTHPTHLFPQSSGAGNALTMSGALGSTRAGGAGNKKEAKNDAVHAKHDHAKHATNNANAKGVKDKKSNNDIAERRIEGNDRNKKAFERLTNPDTREMRNTRDDARQDRRNERGGGIGGRGAGRDGRGGRGHGRDDRGGRGGRHDNRGGRQFDGRGGRGERNDDRVVRGAGRDDRGGRGGRNGDRGGQGGRNGDGPGRGAGRDNSGKRRGGEDGEEMEQDDFIPAGWGGGRDGGRGRMSGHRRGRDHDVTMNQGDDFNPAGRGGGRFGARGGYHESHFERGGGGRFERGGGRSGRGGREWAPGRGPPVKRQRVEEGAEVHSENYTDESYQESGYDAGYHDSGYYDHGYYDQGYYDDGYGGGYGYHDYHGGFHGRGGRFGRGRGRGRFANSLGRTGGRGQAGRFHGDGEGQAVAEEGDGGEGQQSAGGDPSVDAAAVHPSPIVAAAFGGRGPGRGFYRGGRGRGRGGYQHVATILASKQWVRKKDGDAGGASGGGVENNGGGDGDAAQG